MARRNENTIVLHRRTHLGSLDREKNPRKKHEKTLRKCAVLSTLMMNFLHTESFKRAVNVARFLRLCRVPGPALHLAPAHDLIRFQDHGHAPHHTRPVALLDHQLLKDGTSHALLLLCLRANTPPQHQPRRRKGGTRKERRNTEVRIVRNTSCRMIKRKKTIMDRKSNLVLIRVRRKEWARKGAINVTREKLMETK